MYMTGVTAQVLRFFTPENLKHEERYLFKGCVTIADEAIALFYS
jgi:hypothetical protein